MSATGEPTPLGGVEVTTRAVPPRRRKRLSRIKQIRRRVLARMRPPPKLTVLDWANQHLHLPPSLTAEPGKFNDERMPWMREMLLSLTDPLIGEHVWKMASRTGKTTCALAALGYFIDHHPSPMLVKYPTKIRSEGFSKRVLTPIIEATPRLRDRVKEAKGRNSENTILFKKFAGGFVTMVGSESAADLRGDNCRVIFQDEIDSDAKNTSKEGAPWYLADKRAETFGDAILIKASTPTIKGQSNIDHHFERSDQCFWHVPCPHCGHFQILKWENVKWLEDGDGSDAWYQCDGPTCAKPWSDLDRIHAISKGRWVATKPFKGIRGYSISGLYRLIGRKRHHVSYLHEFVVEYLQAMKSEETKKVWINTFKNESYDEVIERVEPDTIAERAEDYGPAIPNEVVVLTFGTDLRNGFIESFILGTGQGEESWGIEFARFPGDIHSPDPWETFDEWLLQPRFRVDGTPMQLTAGCIDTGFAAKMVYAFCGPRLGRNIFAVKGSSLKGMPAISIPRKSGVDRVLLHMVGTDTLKKLIYARLNLKEKGKGYIHFPKGFGFDDDYFVGLTVEEVKRKIVANGIEETYFENPPGARNEPLDCMVYALAALARMQMTDKKLTRRAERLKYFAPVLPPVPVEVPSPTPEPAPVAAPRTEPLPRRVKKLRPGGFVRNW